MVSGAGGNARSFRDCAGARSGRCSRPYIESPFCMHAELTQTRWPVRC